MGFSTPRSPRYSCTSLVPGVGLVGGGRVSCAFSSVGRSPGRFHRRFGCMEGGHRRIRIMGIDGMDLVEHPNGIFEFLNPRVP